VHKGELITPADVFDHPYWDWVRNRIAEKAAEIRAQGFFGAAMLFYSELEYGGAVLKWRISEKNYEEKTGVKKLTTSFLLKRGNIIFPF